MLRSPPRILQVLDAYRDMWMMRYSCHPDAWTLKGPTLKVPSSIAQRWRPSFCQLYLSLSMGLTAKVGFCCTLDPSAGLEKRE